MRPPSRHDSPTKMSVIRGRDRLGRNLDVHGPGVGCKQCGKSIVGMQYSAEFCRPPCSKVWHRRVRRATARVVGMCVWCGDAIINRKKHALFCSPRCQGKNGYDANRQKEAVRTRTKLAVNSGRLHRPSMCSACGFPCKPDAHHYRGYEPSMWDCVVWLCRSCHKDIDSSPGAYIFREAWKWAER